MNMNLKDFNDYLKKRVSDGTRKIYIDHLTAWFKKLDGEPTKRDAQEYIDTLSKLSPNTIGIIGHSIMRWFKWNDMDIKLDLPTIRIKEPEYLNTEQFKKFVNSCVTLQEKVIAVGLFDTAVRISEFINLTLDDIHYDTKTITVRRKGGRKEDVNISDKALELIKEWLERRKIDSYRLFGEMTYYDAWTLLKGVAYRAGLEFHPHMLRHSRAVQMLGANAEMHVVQQHLGHVNLATTANIYGKFKTVDLKKKIPDW